MRRFPLALIVAFLAVSPLACSDDDDPPTGLPPGDEDFVAMLGCVGEGLEHIGLAIETSLILFHELDETAPTPTPGFSYNEDTGTFHYSKILFTAPGSPTDIDGFVEPLEVVADGLDLGDNFTVTWELLSGLDMVGFGSFRVIHNGLTSPPDQNETMRMLPADEITVNTGGYCNTTVGQFELHVHHLVADNEIATAIIGFETLYTGSDVPVTLTGLLTANDDSGIGTISATYKGATYNCTVDLDSYEVSCTPG
jgi:hypothetical protein